MSSIGKKFTTGILKSAEMAAIAASQLIGGGDKEGADQLAVDAMRTALNEIEFDGRIVIGEGERDEAPMLYIGEKVGTGNGDAVDIALDPLEGTTITSKGMPNSLAVIAAANKGFMLHSPDTYMNKIAIGGGYSEDVIDLDASVTDNIISLAQAKKVKPSDVTACVLERDRHADIIDSLRSIGSKIVLIPDGDVQGVMMTSQKDIDVDIYFGTGGAPEGVLAAAALQCIGGQIQTRLVIRNDDEKHRAENLGIKDLDKKYFINDLASGDIVFVATGVTEGTMVKGVKKLGNIYTAHSIVLRSDENTTQYIQTQYPNIS
jgi:fructose-1,6-bisphosphatase II / sedoheptulose-1,7-bisphosphatase